MICLFCMCVWLGFVWFGSSEERRSLFQRNSWSAQVTMVERYDHGRTMNDSLGATRKAETLAMEIFQIIQ